MTFRWIEGFETIGTPATPDTTVMDALTLRFNPTSSNLSDEATLIDDFENSGATALRMPSDDTFGSYGLRLELPDSLKNGGASAPDLVVGFRVKPHDLTTEGTTPDVIRIHYSEVNALDESMSFSADGTDIIWDDATGVETISDVVDPTSWYYIELEFKYANAGDGGYLKIYVNGTQVFSDASRSISSFSRSIWGIQFRCDETADGTGDKWLGFDDIVIYDLDGSDHTEAIGPVRIRRHGPNADGGTTDWTPSTGTDNYALVDEVTVDDTDYVETSTDNTVDRYELENSEAGIGNIVGVGVEAECFNTVGGTPTVFTGLKNSTTDEEGTVVDDTVDNTYVRSCHTNHPDGGDWTNSTFDAIESHLRFQS